MHHRKEKLEELIKRLISEYILKNPIIYINGESLPFITINRIVISEDLGHIKVFFLAFQKGADEVERKKANQQIIRSLNRHSGQVKHHLVQSGIIRGAQDIIFAYDEGVENEQRVEELLSKNP